MRQHAGMPALLSTRAIDLSPRRYLDSVGKVFAVFGPPTQDSGNVSYGVSTRDGRCFVKTTDPDADVLLAFGERVELLRNAAALATRCPHPAMPSLLNVIESPAGPMLVYEWVEGELLRRRPDEADSAHERFRALPVPVIVAALNVIFELHQALAEAGYIASDFYDGCLIHDFAAGRIRVIDLDHYHMGPFVNHMGRLFGSSRFMAPEEFERGALIDERTTVFNLGRTGRIFLGDRGSRQRLRVLAKACANDAADRFDTVAGFVQAWRACG